MFSCSLCQGSCPVVVVGIVAVSLTIVSALVLNFVENRQFAEVIKGSADPIATACAMSRSLSGETAILCTLRAMK